MDEPKISVNRGNAGKGRPPGSPNKTTALLKDAILKAATNAGGGDMVAYLEVQATENPASFMTLLGKVLPIQHSGDEDNPIRHIAEIRRVIVDAKDGHRDSPRLLSAAEPGEI